MHAIEVRDLHVSYHAIKQTSIRNSLRGMKLGKNKTFYAVRGVSFDVEEGEILGIVGSNGSGKSTTLNAIAGIFAPNQGTIDTFGHSVGLLAIGVGFQPDLTGRTNIMLSGLLLGFSKKEVQAHMDEIIEFSELGSFINQPVKTYSSGMHSKLAFAITSILEPEIMLIDEVFSVGDARFRKKSQKKMRELIQKPDRTVLIVSHSSESLRTLCDRVLWLEKGEVKMIGPTKEVLDAYAAFMGEPLPGKKKKKKPLPEGQLPAPVLRRPLCEPEGVRVRWKKVPEAEMYRVMRRSGPDGWKTIRYTKKSGFLDKTAEPGRSYRYTVRCATTARKAAGPFRKEGVRVKFRPPAETETDPREETADT